MDARVLVRHLYRSYLREATKLPHLYLRQFFQIRARDDVNSVLSVQGQDRWAQKSKLVQKNIHRVHKANNGDRKAFNRVLQIAYGRVGKLKWELLEPIRYPNNTDYPNNPIIPGVEKSRPPIYSPELKALFTSPLARLNKPLERNDFHNPRTLPPRADPLSEEARTFGSFSKRREVNIRRRFFHDELRKVLPPLEIAEMKGPVLNAKVPLRPLAFQQIGAIQDLETLIGHNLFHKPPKTRRERRSLSAGELSYHLATDLERHPSRWVRRRYRTLLAHIPQLVYDPKPNLTQPFRVEKHPLGHHPHDRSTRCMPDVDPVTMAWVEQRSTLNIKQASNANKKKK